eukprot:8423648-Pyramimonas_sp.AAC.1
MPGPWKAISELLGRGAANKSGPGWTEEASMQGYPWEGCPSLPCGWTVSWLILVRLELSCCSLRWSSPPV